MDTRTLPGYSLAFRLVTVFLYKYTTLANSNYYSNRDYQMKVQIPGGARKATLSSTKRRNGHILQMNKKVKGNLKENSFMKLTCL